MNGPSIQKVFLSSTNADLAKYRDAALAAIEASDHLKCLDYRNWGPRPTDAHGICRDKVHEAALFVGLLGPYRGWEVPGDNRRRSITELEFDWATDSGKPRFVCVTPDDFPVPAGIRESDEVYGRQLDFRRRVMADGANVVSQDFSSPDRLATIVINALLGYLLAEQMRRSARNSDAASVRDDRSVRDALRQLADDRDADLDAMLDHPSEVDGRELEERLHSRALGLLEARAKAQSQAAKYFRHIGALAFLRDTGKAIEAYRQATTLDPEHADGWRQLGVLHIRRGDYADARTALETARELARTGGDLALEGRIVGNLGAIDWFQDRLTDAEKLFARDLAISRQLENRDGIARSSGNLGLIYMKLARFVEAEAMHGEALAVARQLANQIEEARQIGNLAEVKRARGEPEAAMRLHEQALALDETLHNREGVARHSGNLGELYQEAGDLVAAVRHFKRALEIDTDLQNRSGQARHLENLGRLRIRLADDAEAARLLESALSLYEAIAKWGKAARCAADLAEVLERTGDRTAAAELLDKAVRYVADDTSADTLRTEWEARRTALKS